MTILIFFLRRLFISLQSLSLNLRAESHAHSPNLGNNSNVATSKDYGSYDYNDLEIVNPNGIA